MGRPGALGTSFVFLSLSPATLGTRLARWDGPDSIADVRRDLEIAGPGDDGPHSWRVELVGNSGGGLDETESVDGIPFLTTRYSSQEGDALAATQRMHLVVAQVDGLSRRPATWHSRSSVVARSEALLALAGAVGTADAATCEAPLPPLWEGDAETRHRFRFHCSPDGEPVVGRPGGGAPALVFLGAREVCEGDAGAASCDRKRMAEAILGGWAALRGWQGAEAEDDVEAMRGFLRHTRESPESAQALRRLSLALYRFGQRFATLEDGPADEDWARLCPDASALQCLRLQAHLRALFRSTWTPWNPESSAGPALLYASRLVQERGLKDAIAELQHAALDYSQRTPNNPQDSVQPTPEVSVPMDNPQGF